MRKEKVQSLILINDRVPNIIFSSQSSIIDWLILMFRHSPKFLWIVKSLDSQSDIFIELTYLDIFFFGIGLKFLSTKDNKYSAFNFSQYILTDNHVPLVIFPENTKTNRNGVLSIRSNLMDKIYNLVNDHGRMLLRSEIIIKKNNHFTLHNTTDKLGFKFLFYTSSQILNSVEVIAQDIPNNNFDKSSTFDRLKFNKVEESIDVNLQSHLVEPNNRNIVTINMSDHISFLEYFHQTSRDASYVKKDE